MDQALVYLQDRRVQIALVVLLLLAFYFFYMKSSKEDYVTASVKEAEEAGN